MSILRGLSIWVAIFAVTVVLNLFPVPFAVAEEEKVQKEYELEVMTVTAQKKEENVQDVPMSISVFSDIQIEDAGIENTLELTRFTPNLYMGKSGSVNQIIIRGISPYDIDTSIYSPAGLYVDDVSFPLNYMYNTDLFDIERIEVLKGPQGTLYGRNSESGVINIITKQPDNELRGKIFGEYGSYDTEHGSSPSYRAGGNISGPIVRDKLYLGLAGQWENSDGFMKNEYNNDEQAAKIDHINGRGTLRWTPTNKWDISFIADAMDTDDGLGIYKFMTGQNKTDRHKIKHDGGEDYSEQEGNGQTFRIKYEGDSFNLLSVSGRRYYQHKYATDIDCTADPLNNLGNYYFTYENDQLSEEIRVSSPNDSGPFEWLIGVYGFKEETDIDIDNPWSQRLTDMDTKGYAVFGQGTYTLFDKLHLTAGLRYDHQDLEGKQEYKFIDMMTGSPQSLNLDKDLDYDEVLPKFSIAYDFTGDIMTYISASKGYITGGYNYAIAGDLESFYYDPEYTWNYEAGLKTAWLDKKVIANLAVFYIDIEDKQVFEQLYPYIMEREITNAAEAHSMGIELELQARPTQGLDVFAGLGYTDTEFDDWTATEIVGYNPDWTPIMGTYDYEGKDLPHAPEYTYNFGVQYRHQSGFLEGLISLE
jgi:iron complex outermembrane receptor protein